jgi:hypothetical protein
MTSHHDSDDLRVQFEESLQVGAILTVTKKARKGTEAEQPL